MPKKVFATKAVAEENNHAVPLSVVSNEELCALRAPEEVSYTVENAEADGSFVFAAGSFTVIRMRRN